MTMLYHICVLTRCAINELQRSAVAQWVECLTRDLRVMGFESHGRHCVVALSMTFYPLLSNGSTQENPSRYYCKIVDKT